MQGKRYCREGVEVAQRRAAGRGAAASAGGVMNRDDKAGCGRSGVGGLAALAGLPGGVRRAGGGRGCDELATIRGGSAVLGGWWCVPTCQLFDFPAFRLIGKLESWRDRAEGARQGLGGARRTRRARAVVVGDGKGWWSQARKHGAGGAVGG